MITIQVDGLRELQRALRATSEKAPKVIQTAHKQVAEITAKEAQRFAAGTTLGSRIKAFGTTRHAGVRLLGHKPKGSSKSTDARLQEYGGRVPLFGDRQHWFLVKAINPDGYYLNPAVEATHDQAMAIYLEKLDEALTRHFAE
jgi:hypothetical protein